MATATGKQEMRWLPLESNPDVMNQYIKNLGMIDGDYEITDIFSFDDELLGMVPQPAIAVLFLYPITAENEQKQKELEVARDAKDIFYVKQTIGNACGTIGLLHALGNNRDKLQFHTGSFLQEFFENARDKTPDERAKLLEGDRRLAEAHSESAQQGATENTEETMNTDLHFVAFVQIDSHLYELDGRKAGPISRGKSDNLLTDSVRVIKEYMALNPDRLEFAACALSPKQG